MMLWEWIIAGVGLLVSIPTMTVLICTLFAIIKWKKVNYGEEK